MESREAGESGFWSMGNGWRLGKKGGKMGWVCMRGENEKGEKRESGMKRIRGKEV